MAESMTGLKRSSRCALVSENDIGKELTLMGWVQRRRNLGALIFVDLRDISGLIQMRKPKYSTMRMGSLMSMAMEAVMEFSTSDTSPVMRAMMSPLRSSVKKPMGRLRILS